MTDAQLISIAVTVLAILGATLVNNSRISDLNGSLNRRIDDTRDVLRAEMQLQRKEIELAFTSINHKLDEILRIPGDHETRIPKIETRIQ